MLTPCQPAGKCLSEARFRYVCGGLQQFMFACNIKSAITVKKG
jgi:hypothetical protein